MAKVRPAWWRQVATRYLVPELPGAWRTTGRVLHATPVGWLLRGLLCDSTGLGPAHFRLEAFVQLLPKAAVAWDLSNSRRVAPGQLWDAKDTVEEAEPQMRELARMARHEAIPFLDEFGTPDGYLSWLNQRVSDMAGRSGEGWEDLHIDEQLVYINLIRGDIDKALGAVEWAERASRLEDAPWVREVYGRIQRVARPARRHDLNEAIQALREQANQTCQRLKLPAIEGP